MHPSGDPEPVCEGAQVVQVAGEKRAPDDEEFCVLVPFEYLRKRPDHVIEGVPPFDRPRKPEHEGVGGNPEGGAHRVPIHRAEEVGVDAVCDQLRLIAVPPEFLDEPGRDRRDDVAVVQVVAGYGEDPLPDQPFCSGVPVIGGRGVGKPVFEVEDNRHAVFSGRADHRRSCEDVSADDDIDVVVPDDIADDPVVAG